MANDESPLAKLLGPSLLRKPGTNVSTADAFKGKELVILYFSASWCGPCMAFTPMFMLFYSKCALEGKIEVVFVSSDKDSASFQKYYEQMPWLALPFESKEIKEKLSDTFQVSGIPSALVLDCKTGNFITDDAPNRVKKAARGMRGLALELVESWKSMESVPIEQAAAKIKEDNKRNPVVAAIMFLLKNPLSIIGLVYLYKYLSKQYATVLLEEGNNPNQADL